ncbi:hypothetical protein BKP45_13740 [Anaerobacillus alkalidiazotrophicus]|uniref:Uncharacterized protein n=1 Tax=Anaerobacillus alkalidiazotrophicus TaxID=472963 RepID=A0A1S2M5S6_9BACI|nr:hypothetical protein [Anaerobacillus alkalidiazotrophicus]OIJ19217.1 hypothetical protein BKP45_13740 [Anaerobacillus alkalidiazotrophicus]
MKKLFVFMLICLFLLMLTGFESQNDLEITDVETTLIKAEHILRYDIKIKNLTGTRLVPVFDYPGHYYYGFEIVIKPNKKLASLMVMDDNTKYKKMMFRGGGASGFLEPGVDTTFSVEYQIKDDSDLEKVKKYAFDSTLLFLDGTKVIAEFPLKKFD